MKWNEQLRRERKSQGWTQSLLAQKIGTNTYTVGRESHIIWWKNVPVCIDIFEDNLDIFLEHDRHL